LKHSEIMLFILFFIVDKKNKVVDLFEFDSIIK